MFIEVRSFGFNSLTFVFICTLVFTTLQAYALISQNNRIVNNKAGDSVSFVFFSYYTFSAIAVTFYGYFKHSLALVINGMLGFVSVFILINLLRFKKIKTWEAILGGASAISIPLIILSKEKDMLFLVFGIVVMSFLMFQIIELAAMKKVGSVHPSQAIVSLFSGSFWLIYAFIANIWPLKIINTIGVCLWPVLLLEYLYFRNKKAFV